MGSGGRARVAQRLPHGRVFWEVSQSVGCLGPNQSFLYTFSYVKKPASVRGPMAQNTPTSAMSQPGRSLMGMIWRRGCGTAEHIRAGSAGRRGGTRRPGGAARGGLSGRARALAGAASAGAASHPHLEESQ